MEYTVSLQGAKLIAQLSAQLRYNDWIDIDTKKPQNFNLNNQTSYFLGAIKIVLIIIYFTSIINGQLMMVWKTFSLTRLLELVFFWARRCNWWRTQDVKELVKKLNLQPSVRFLLVDSKYLIFIE